MFTGIITNLGRVKTLDYDSNKDLFIQISTKNNIERKLEIGCSIACNGICLTLTKKEISADNLIFSFQASQETLDKTTIKNWQINQLINLEFALRMGDELGGHMVLGHVDDVAKIVALDKLQDSHLISFQFNKDLCKFIAPKGSICLNGVSLTINLVQDDVFSVNLVEHSFKNTAFGEAKIGDLVNLEIDAIARYLERLVKN